MKSKPQLTTTLLGEFGLFLDGRVISSFNGDRPISLLHRRADQSGQPAVYPN